MIADYAHLPHLTDEEVADFLSGGLAEADRVRVERHLIDCPACRREVIEVQGILATAHDPANGNDRRPRRGRGQLIGGVALAAAALATLLLIRPPEPPPAPALRNGPTVTERARILRVSAPSAGPVDPAGAVFRWEEAGDDALYQFTLLAQDGGVVWTTRTRADSLLLPDPVVLRLAPGQYYWRTDALLSDLSAATTGEQTIQVSP